MKELSASSSDQGGPQIRWIRQRPWVLTPGVAGGLLGLALAGLPVGRLLVCAAMSAALVLLVIAQALRSERVTSDSVRRAVFISLLCTIVLTCGIAGASGGLASPYLVVTAGPAVVAVMAFGPGRAATTALALLALCILALALLPLSVTGPPFPWPIHGYLTLWALIVLVAVFTREFRLLSKGLLQTSQSLRSMQEELLREATARRREIESVSSKVAHEIKNPLTALKSLLQLEKAAAKEERSQKRFEVMTSELARMEGIVRDYLSLARPLTSLSVGEADLGRIADDVVAILEGRAGDAGVSLRREGKGAAIVGDDRRLKEALLNLAQNALEATPPGGTVAIVVEPTGDGARVMVRDTGTGIAAAVAGRLGTSFVTTRVGGTGLGLSIARSIITQHHGTLELGNSPDGGGAVATVILPRSPAPSEEAHGQNPAS